MLDTRPRYISKVYFTLHNNETIVEEVIEDVNATFNSTKYGQEAELAILKNDSDQTMIVATIESFMTQDEAFLFNGVFMRVFREEFSECDITLGQRIECVL